ncbi:MAG: hypothetical protein GY797_31010 [Deltaproteobacteria bacterium]|nr:hypothetical protein [Deltaproteobacteria bacterium]
METFIRGTVLKKMGWIILLCFIVINCTECQGENFSDHFTSQNPGWNWSYSAGTGYHICPMSIDGLSDTICEIGTTAETTDQEYSDCALFERATSHNSPDVFETRLKCTGNNELGTKGWGFFDGSLERPNAVWFCYAGPSSADEFKGFRALIFLNGKVVFGQLITEYSMDEWHTYRIERYRNGAEFFIDNTSIAKYRGSMPDKSMILDIWTDNFIVKTGLKLSYAKITQAQKIYIDWVHWRQLKKIRGKT